MQSENQNNLKIQNDYGVIIGTSRNQEWLLPWWWMHFSAHNSLPVTFVDFGDLSTEAVEWCKKRGDVVRLELSNSFMASKDAIDPKDAQLWEKMHPEVWKLRFTWYKKPFALLLSPYKKTIWLDPDCQVRGSLIELFEQCENPAGIAVAPEHESSQNLNMSRNLMREGEIMCNAGVVVFRKDSKIIQQWAEQSKTLNHLYCSDQQLLVHVLFSQKLPFSLLSQMYNWTVDQGPNQNAVIYHWWGSAGKQILQNQVEFLNKQIFCNLTFSDTWDINEKSKLQLP